MSCVSFTDTVLENIFEIVKDLSTKMDLLDNKSDKLSRTVAGAQQSSRSAEVAVKSLKIEIRGVKTDLSAVATSIHGPPTAPVARFPLKSEEEIVWGVIRPKFLLW